jgi:PelA/Pel-15E family pectate lyase
MLSHALRKTGRFLVAVCALYCAGSAIAQGSVEPGRTAVLATMQRATHFMLDKVAYKGGYVWSYLPDMSRRWGEMEAYPTMIWIQPPGTGTVGHLYLDAFHATGDAYYYKAAEQVADALVRAQLPSGGWGYMADFAGEDSIRRWYDTVGKNGWRLEEFLHYYGNSTFDDEGTSEASQFLLRMYLEKKDAKYKAPLDRAIQLVLDSQYANGGWPQRYPAPRQPFAYKGKPDYTGYITLNDSVADENIKFLIMVYQTLGDKRAYDAIIRGMNIFLVLQQPKPQAGWAMQYTPGELKPLGARSYEPDALTTHTTAQVIDKLMDFYTLTGDAKFLARIPEALDWLDAVKLPPEQQRPTRTHPTFIELGTNRPMYVHRRGSNVVNGEYYADYNPDKTIVHYGAFRKLDVAKLRERYAQLKATSPAEASKDSPLLAKGIELPRYFSLADLNVSDLTAGHMGVGEVTPERVGKLLESLNAEGYWPTPLKATSNPYKGDGSATPVAGDYSMTRVGDDTDTSPYIASNPPLGISTGAYIKNMGELIRYLGQLK